MWKKQIRAGDGKAKHPCFTEKCCGHLQKLQGLFRNSQTML